VEIYSTFQLLVSPRIMVLEPWGWPKRTQNGPEIPKMLSAARGSPWSKNCGTFSEVNFLALLGTFCNGFRFGWRTTFVSILFQVTVVTKAAHCA